MAKVEQRFSPQVESFIETYDEALRNGTAAVFAGAGLSASSGYVNWKELLRGIAADLGLDVDRETNLVAIAQYHYNERSSRSHINQTLVNEFSKDHEVNENHEILAGLPIRTYWTTNYDHMIENALRDAGKNVERKHSVASLRTTTPNSDAVVYKMHGDVDDPDNAVLTKDDYEGYFRDRELFVTKLTADLVSKTMLFVGFSFSDPNIDYVLSRIRVVLNKKPKQHYCILRRLERLPREKLRNYEYRKRQQDYFVKDLSRLGIRVLVVDEYKDVTRILRAIEEKYRTRTVFISGSASDFHPWSADDAANFIESMAAGLIKNKFNIVSGFGLGVGPSVISGALQTIQSSPRRFSRDQLHTFPFPISNNLGNRRASVYRRHREEIIKKAGIAIFLFGNKRKENGDIVRSEGVFEEYEIARQMGLHTIAVGATGWVAQEIANITGNGVDGRSKAFGKAHLILSDFNSSVEDMVKSVLLMVNEIRR
ncbi:hypothetical protein R20233_00394 [Ralstonia sp. LMG 32965]|uniref:SIR2 family protein n=1 Tax=Ralstonia flatus TaxID=3058601 RepID=UPI0028F6277F|nr:SIR2 family protein [Ralstonia sp. LMG 32965]CAJ0856302.1 hypothetical protein R20233_00394 [Ralstonia sp. LMG 32965]